MPQDHNSGHRPTQNVCVEMGDDLKTSQKTDDIDIGFFKITNLPRNQQFFILTVGVMLFYLIYGYFQELMFRLDGFRPFGWYLTLIQFGYYTVFGITGQIVKKDRRRKVPMKTYCFLAFLTVSTMGLSNSSLGYLNYPIQIIFKCCKLVPVLIGGILIQKKTYTALDFAACICMSIGLIFFTLADSTVSPSFNYYGLLLISLALVADAVIGNVQEKTMKQFSSSNSEMVLYSYSIGFLYILIGQLITGQFWDAFMFCWHYPVQTYGYAFIFSFTGYLGLIVVLSLVKSFGALIAVTVTTCRKAITIILSFMFFTKPFTQQYIWSGLLVVLGIYLNVYSKNKLSWNRTFVKIYHRYFVSRQSFSDSSQHIV